MILQITRQADGEEQENLVDGVSDVVSSISEISYVEKDNTLRKIVFDAPYKENNKLLNIYLLNDDGKTIKKVYQSTY